MTAAKVELAQQQVANVSVPSGSVVVQADVHADLTDWAYDSEVSAYFRDSDSPQPPSALLRASITAACNIAIR